MVIVAAALLSLLVIFSCRQQPRNEEIPLYSFPEPYKNEPRIRMLVRQNAPAVTVAVTGSFKLYDSRGALIPNTNSRLARISATYSQRERCLMLGNQPLRPNGDNLERVRISPDESGTLELEGRAYPGELELIAEKKNGTLHAVVRMGLEDYVIGVLAGEVPWETWNEEALKAQAVASRTYALYYSLRNQDALWDFGDTGRYAQQFKPGTLRNSALNRIVGSTAGEVLTWNNMIFPAWFHSSCGGHTADASTVFTRQRIDPLGGVECPWCKEVPGNKYASWKKELNIANVHNSIGASRDLREDPAVGDAIKHIGPVRALEVAGKAPDGRITSFVVRGPYTPGSVEVRANDIRLAIGPSVLPSTNCTMTAAGGRYHFDGSGWGHGVGLCQFGAQGQALKGRSYQDIVATYFPSSRLVKLTYARPGAK